MLLQIINKAATIVTEDIGLEDFFSETDFGVKKYEAYKQVLLNNPDIVDKINDPNLSDAEKQVYQNQILQAVNQKLGIQIAKDVKVISTNEPGQGGKQVAGFITTKNDTIYSNEKNQDTAKDTMYALGQEIAGSYQKSQGIDITTDRDQHKNYQDMVAQDTIDDMSFLSKNYGLDINLNTVNNHNTNLNQVTSTPSVFNSQAVNNNLEFSGLDKEAGDNMPFIVIPIVVGLIGLEESLNAPEDNKKLYTPFEVATQVGRDFAQTIRDNPKGLANGLSDAGVIADSVAAATIVTKNPKNIVKATTISVIGAGFGVASELISPSSPESFAHDRQLDAATSIIKEPYGTVIKIMGQEILDTVDD